MQRLLHRRRFDVVCGRAKWRCESVSRSPMEATRATTLHVTPIPLLQQSRGDVDSTSPCRAEDLVDVAIFPIKLIHQLILVFRWPRHEQSSVRSGDPEGALEVLGWCEVDGQIRLDVVTFGDDR